LQNVFEQEVFRPTKYGLTPKARERIQTEKISLHGFEHLFDKEFADARRFDKVLSNQKILTDHDRNFILDSTEIDNLEITALQIDSINTQLITEKSILSLRELEGRVFKHRWQLEEALAERSVYWRQFGIFLKWSCDTQKTSSAITFDDCKQYSAPVSYGEGCHPG
jgi:PiT family inorganic phosphate transporter